MKKKLIIGLIIALLVAIIVIGIIIYNNRFKNNIAKDFILDDEDKYLITTDEQYLTLRSDGGTHSATRYNIDLKRKTVVKVGDDYNGPKREYNYKNKIFYEKTLSNEGAETLKKIFNKMKEDKEEYAEIVRTHNRFIMIDHMNDERLYLYSEDEIKKIEDIIKK